MLFPRSWYAFLLLTGNSVTGMHINLAISAGVKNLNLRLFNTSKFVSLSLIICFKLSSHKLEYTEPVPHKYERVKQHDLVLCLVTMSRALPPFNSCLLFIKYFSKFASVSHNTSDTCLTRSHSLSSQWFSVIYIWIKKIPIQISQHQYFTKICIFCLPWIMRLWSIFSNLWLGKFNDSSILTWSTQNILLHFLQLFYSKFHISTIKLVNFFLNIIRM